MEIIDLYELQSGFKEALEEAFPQRVWVRAEVSSIQVKSNGHCYMDLSQTEDGRVIAKAKAVIWRNRYLPVSTYFREVTGGDICAGMQILARVLASFSEIYGLTLTIDEVEPQLTLGEAELEKRRTIAKLEADGLMDRQKQLSPVLLPYRLAVISARDAAGYGDFCRHLEQNPYGFRFEVTLFEAQMQGEGSPASVVDALERIQAESAYDVALMIRGGGSALDLACFDDYGMAFAIATCGIPVYTAIGHDRDYHVADMVSFGFVKTPTALADMFVAAFAAEDERISSYGNRLKMAFLSKVSEMGARIDMLASRIHSADPRGVLSRGYSLITDASGVVLKSALSVKPGDKIGILFEDGRINAIVDGKI